jgi:hypothetical protein
MWFVLSLEQKENFTSLGAKNVYILPYFHTNFKRKMLASFREMTQIGTFKTSHNHFPTKHITLKEVEHYVVESLTDLFVHLIRSFFCVYGRRTSQIRMLHKIPILKTGSLKPMPQQWIDADTKHIVTRLTDDVKSNYLFRTFNNPFTVLTNQTSHQSNGMVFIKSHQSISITSNHIQPVNSPTHSNSLERIQIPQLKLWFKDLASYIFKSVVCFSLWT